MKYIISDKFTGEILRYGSCQASDWQLQFDESIEEIYSVQSTDVVSDTTHYVDNGKIVSKLNFPININKNTILSDSIDSCVISNIPANTKLIWEDGVVETINDGVIELSVSQPGTYTITLSGIKYLGEEITIEAVN